MAFEMLAILTTGHIIVTEHSALQRAPATLVRCCSLRTYQVFGHQTVAPSMLPQQTRSVIDLTNEDSSTDDKEH